MMVPHDASLGTPLHVTKMYGLGNDFVVIDATHKAAHLAAAAGGTPEVRISGPHDTGKTRQNAWLGAIKIC